MDEQLLLWINQGWAGPWADIFFIWISSRGAFGLPLLGLLLWWCLRRYGSDGLRLWLLLAGALIAGDLIGNLLKGLLQQPRPCAVIFDLLRQPLRPQGGSCNAVGTGMPSNHALNFFLAAAFVGAATRARTVTLALFCIAVLVGLSRIYLGVHYPSQVAAGMLIGTALGLLAAWLGLKYLPFMRRIRAIIATGTSTP